MIPNWPSRNRHRTRSVSNYHFEGRIKDDELYFDYKLKKGICESLNATTLMKKIGIHFQD